MQHCNTFLVLYFHNGTYVSVTHVTASPSVSQLCACVQEVNFQWRVFELSGGEHSRANYYYCVVNRYILFCKMVEGPGCTLNGEKIRSKVQKGQKVKEIRGGATPSAVSELASYSTRLVSAK